MGWDGMGMNHVEWRWRAGVQPASQPGSSASPDPIGKGALATSSELPTDKRVSELV